MVLPRSARRFLILVLRDQVTPPVDPDPTPVDGWGREVRDGYVEVARFQGDIQTRSGREMASSLSAGAAVASHVIFAPVVDIHTGDLLRVEPDDGRRFDVQFVGRPGPGRRLDHLEVLCQVTQKGIGVVPEPP